MILAAGPALVGTPASSSAAVTEQQHQKQLEEYRVRLLNVVKASYGVLNMVRRHACVSSKGQPCSLALVTLGC